MREEVFFYFTVIAMKTLYFCHPETDSINGACEGSMPGNNAFIYCGADNTCKF